VTSPLKRRKYWMKNYNEEVEEIEELEKIHTLCYSCCTVYMALSSLCTAAVSTPGI
jgi:hypothetical protein